MMVHLHTSSTAIQSSAGGAKLDGAEGLTGVSVSTLTHS